MASRTQSATPTPAWRRAPLAAALLLAGAGEAPAMSLGVATPAGWRPGDGAGVAALVAAVHAVPRKPRSPQPPLRRAVSSCADDGSAGSLRAVIAAANDGDTVDLRGLACSTITLAQGAIPLPFDNLTLDGPGAERLAIDGALTDRVFVHYGYGELRLRGVTVQNGFNAVAGYRIAGGACVLSGGYVTLDHAAVRGCIAVGEGAYGGGLLARGVTLYTSTLSGNVARGSPLRTLTASYGGGAFAYRGSAALYDSTVSGNRAEPDPNNRYGSYDTGGGLFSDNGGYASRSTVAGNYTDGTGGGIASHAGFFVGNSTISGNVARAKPGGGLFVRLADAFSIRNSTIAFNQAIRGGGVYLAGSPRAFALDSTILAGNRAADGADLAAAQAVAVVGANNLVQEASAAIALPPDTRHADPKLLPLAANGGPTPTHALAPDSPAIDAGNDLAGFATDQRGDGYPRVQGAAADIGAFESAPAPPAPAAVPLAAPRGLALLAALLLALGLVPARARKR